MLQDWQQPIGRRRTPRVRLATMCRSLASTAVIRSSTGVVHIVVDDDEDVEITGCRHEVAEHRGTVEADTDERLARSEPEIFDQLSRRGLEAWIDVSCSRAESGVGREQDPYSPGRDPGGRSTAGGTRRRARRGAEEARWAQRGGRGDAAPCRQARTWPVCCSTSRSSSRSGSKESSRADLRAEANARWMSIPR